MRKEILFIILELSVFLCYSQNIDSKASKRDSINLFDICINNICIGDSLSKAYKILSKPDSIYSVEEIEDEDSPENITVYSTLIWGSNKNQRIEIIERKLFKNKRSPQSDKVFLFYVRGKGEIFFSGRGAKLPIGSELELIKNAFPLSYKNAIDFQQASYQSDLKRFEDNKKQYEKIKQEEKYLQDKKYRISVDQNYNKMKDPRSFFNPGNIFINVKITNNEFNYYTRLSFGYEEGKLKSIYIMNDY